LFPHHRYRFWGHYTDAEGDPVALDAHMRRHLDGRVELRDRSQGRVLDRLHGLQGLHLRVVERFADA
jgi:hypothetical protein